MSIALPKAKKKRILPTPATFTDLFGVPQKVLKLKKKKKARKNPHLMPHMVDLSIYDHFLVQFSGGKDSLAALLYLLDRGVERSKIEIWHQCIDGREGSELMDWDCTEDYCRKVAEAFGLPIFYSWKKGGFEGEMTRLNRRTNPTCFEDGNHQLHTVGGVQGNCSTRMLFPQVTANLGVRWCSSYMKVMVMKSAIVNQERFFGKKTLIVTGERGEESANRNTYEVFEIADTDLRHSKKKPRHVDHFRPVLDLKESEVWAMIESYNIRLHPAYYLGYGRVSCINCIFGNNNQFASNAKIAPKKVKGMIGYEKEFAAFHSGKYASYTMKREGSIENLVRTGKPYVQIEMYPDLVELANSKEYYLNIFMEPGQWTLPAGAYSKESCGAM